MKVMTARVREAFRLANLQNLYSIYKNPRRASIRAITLLFTIAYISYTIGFD
jgi:hypothetical protein